MPFRLLPALLLLLPLAEIAVFIFVGQKIGVAATILAVLASTFAGLALMRRQGVSMLRNLQAGAADATAGGEVMRGMLHMVAGLLLAIPGFITSALGLLLLLPFTRSFLWRSLKPEVVISRSAQFYRRRPGSGNSERKPEPSVIDLDTDDFHRDGPSKAAGSEGANRSPWAGPDRHIDG